MAMIGKAYAGLSQKNIFHGNGPLIQAKAPLRVERVVVRAP